MKWRKGKFSSICIFIPMVETRKLTHREAKRLILNTPRSEVAQVEFEFEIKRGSLS